jgi:prepilin-type processing-associated H-X9-DG protein
MGAECGFFAFERPSPDVATDNTLQIDGSRVFLCPEVPDRTNIRNAPYGYNYQFLGNARFKGGQEGNGYIKFPVKVEHINPSATVMAADNLGTAAGKPRDIRTDYRVDGSSVLTAAGNHAWSLDPPRLTATSDFCDDNNRAPENRSAPDPRHNEKFNALFVDGHVKTSGLSAIGYIVNADGSIAANAVDATNRFFSGSGLDDDPPPIQ